MFNSTARRQLRDLLDRQAISDCILRYARGVDRLDAELIRSAFWPDAHDSHGALDGSVENFISQWMPTQDRREGCSHFVTNHLVNFDGRSAADAETYFWVAAKNVDEDALHLTGGRYLDRFVARKGQWRVLTRLVVLDWSCQGDASTMAASLSRGHRGTRNAADPSYERPVKPRALRPHH